MSDDVSIPTPSYRGNRPGRYGRPHGGMDPDTRRLMLFAGGVGAVLICLIGGSMVIGRHDGRTPMVLADTRPIKIKPTNPGGMQIDGAENDVFSGGPNANASRLAPAAESPDPNGLRAAAAPPVRPVVKPAPAAAPQVSAAEVPPAPPPKAVVAEAAAPAHSPAPEPATAAAAPQPAAVAAPHPVAAPTHGHPASVQLAALTSEQAARGEWQILAKRMPGLLDGHQPSFSHVERDGHTFWRLRTTGFSDVAAARSFCEQVRAKGGSCSVAEL